MQAVILAAGDGGRLLPYTSDSPKTLLPIGGRPIITHVLDALRDACVKDVVVVLGYRGEQIRAAIEMLHPCGMRITYMENDAIELGNARSLWAARDAIRGSFLLLMADHYVEAALVRAVSDRADGRCRLGIDRLPADDPRAHDATRALVKDGRVLDLGKELPCWNAVDTGVFWCTRAIVEEMPALERDGELGAMFASLARRGDLDAVDVTGARWIDIDTVDDLRRAEALLAGA